MTENQSTKHSSSSNPRDQGKNTLGIKNTHMQSPVAMKTLELNLSDKHQIAGGNGLSAKTRSNVRGGQSVGRRVNELSTAKKINSNKVSMLRGRDLIETGDREKTEPEAMLISRII